MRRLILLVSLGAIAAGAIVPATASADNVPRNYSQCYSYLRDFFSDIKGRSLSRPSGIASAEWCEILVARRASKLGMPTRNTILTGTASRHAAASVAAHSWDRSNGLVSHLNPGTPVPGDQNALQQLVNTQVDQRIRGAGYCANGHSFADAEITYAAPAKFTDATVGAIRFWKTDPPHRAVLLDPKWTDIGVSVATPSAFPGDTTGYTFVVDLGMCH
jgi:hypothetical protein